MSTEPRCPARGMRAVRALSCALPEPEGTAPPRTRLLQAAPFRRERGRGRRGDRARTQQKCCPRDREGRRRSVPA